MFTRKYISIQIVKKVFILMCFLLWWCIILLSFSDYPRCCFRRTQPSVSRGGKTVQPHPTLTWTMAKPQIAHHACILRRPDLQNKVHLVNLIMYYYVKRSFSSDDENICVVSLLSVQALWGRTTLNVYPLTRRNTLWPVHQAWMSLRTFCEEGKERNCSISGWI